MDKRVRTGCATCRKRRVKCDEAKPICGRCQAGNFVCEGYQPPRQVTASASPGSSTTYSSGSVVSSRKDLGSYSGWSSNSSSRQSSPIDGDPFCEISWRHPNWRQQQLPLYHHFVTTTAVRFFRTDHVGFWRDQVAQMSCSMDFVYEALLAVGALHHASLLSGQHSSAQEIVRLRVLALNSYGNALRLLPSHLGQDTVAETVAVLVVLILLTQFECIMASTKGALRHLWAAIELLRGCEARMSCSDLSNMAPVYHAMIRLDFLAQKLVPFASSSFLRCSDQAIMESPFWTRSSPEFPGISESDCIAGERYRLIQLIAGHNKLSRVVWGNWCPTSERPSREELMGFYCEMILWKESSPATWGNGDGFNNNAAWSLQAMELLTMPPQTGHSAADEAAVNISMFNGYLGCAVAMISTTDPDPAACELEVFNLVYQNLCIAARLIETHNGESGSSYKPCDHISMGICLLLYHGARRCFSLSWQKWTIAALRSVGREGLCDGFSLANTLDIICHLEGRMRPPSGSENSYLGPIRDRLIPLLVPRGDDDKLLAFYLRYGNEQADGDERAIQVVAKATWKEDEMGVAHSLDIEIYDLAVAGTGDVSARPRAVELFHSWRLAVENGWHGYLAPEIEDGFL